MTHHDEDIRHVVSGELASSAVLHADILDLSGLTEESGGVNDANEHTFIILSEVDGYLKRYGSNRQRLLQVQIWISNMEDFDAMNRAWVESPGDGPRLAEACLQAELAGPMY
ncbi:MAG: hypothetical protein RLP45_03450, partial [Haliea sp.]